MNKKSTGSYYTPAYLASFISKRVLSHFRNRSRLSILEPSVGDGAFISELELEKEININLTALDINEVELKTASIKWSRKTGSFVQTDFLEYLSSKQYSAVIGNPPYVKKNILTPKQIELSKKIHTNENLTEASVKNIWTTFLVKANTLLANNGVLAFVLPSELLQVKFAEEIREYLKNQFERIEVFTFNDLMFDCKGQDTIVLFAYKKSDNKGEFFANITSKEALEKNRFVLRNNELLVSSKVKWTHHFLTSEELTFIENLKQGLRTVNDYTNSKPGIVTAANKFFIIDTETEKKYNLSKYTKPIIQKGQFVNGRVVFSNEDIQQLEDNKRPTKLLQLNDNDKISKKLREYLSLGELEEIPQRYKCKIRNNWYVIPNISEIPEAFFFKRSHLYPKLLKNNSNAFVTDSAYKVGMRNGFDLNSFIYSFYNTLTLLLSELDGRYYGGGVLELIPSEFKKLPVPYVEINENQFNQFKTKFESKSNIEQILNRNDFNILNSTLGINKEGIQRLTQIRNKLKMKRLRDYANA
ncbi:Eco57I restriction-modification methylase domain-containing protein [Zunongwangia sp. HRR-M8]|uniref:Eco57I restriction-modification methylase domain-containing protein n=1 Tax=Zunongwangia sp. HRR-M8 TaxID=3015170 RepID=UPI0022DE46D4|nr:N-6 DNA methylase [Zunongwangia sp. HRR-M8]WBL22317.1 Eco57I restriction-modification methylase domain-containing protein [Zunongwangia sp. HRR-M8]